MVQHYQGQEYLTFWTGDDQIRGHGSGAYMMVSNIRHLIQDRGALCTRASEAWNADSCLS
jgi:hypothetical protein